MSKPVIGILTWREGKKYAEPLYFRHLIKEGQQLGATVFVFSPQDVLADEREIQGFIPSPQGDWVSKRFPWPDVVIDRYRNLKPPQAFKKYVQLREQSFFQYTNNRLGNKWDVHQVLWQEENMRSWLPDTCHYSKALFQEMLERYPLLYIKPSNGTGGRGILKIEQLKNGYRLLGRDMSRVKIAARIRSTEAVNGWVEQWVGQEKFIIQQGLSLELIPNRVCDIRLLIQKSGQGQWEITGLGSRIGGTKSSTSNLHGGGKAVSVNRLLTSVFGDTRTQTILNECRDLAFLTARTIEGHYGQLLELGLDIGVDVKGHVWLIEVNPKPGREIFKKMGQVDLYTKAIRQPLEYALYVIKQNQEASSAP